MFSSFIALTMSSVMSNTILITYAYYIHHFTNASVAAEYGAPVLLYPTSLHLMIPQRHTAAPVLLHPNGDLWYFLLIHWRHHHVKKSHNLDRSRQFASEVLVSDNYIFLYETNSALRFYFFLGINLIFLLNEPKMKSCGEIYITAISSSLPNYRSKGET